MTRTDATNDTLARWIRALEERHFAGLRVQEVTRALRALSSVYVERRDGLGRGAALDSAGKRAAFALFYGPLHYLLTRHIVEALDARVVDVDRVIDLGCGTGAAGAAWTIAIREAQGARQEAPGGEPRVLGIDRHRWAVSEARWTYRTLGLQGAARCEDVAKVRLRSKRTAIVLAFAVNELAEAARGALLPHVMRAAREGASVLVVEPVARSIGAWWTDWARAFQKAGGREDSWRFSVELPGPVRLLDLAAGLDHRVLTARSLYLEPPNPEPTNPVRPGLEP